MRRTRQRIKLYEKRRITRFLWSHKTLPDHPSPAVSRMVTRWLEMATWEQQFRGYSATYRIPIWRDSHWTDLDTDAESVVQ